MWIWFDEEGRLFQRIALTCHGGVIGGRRAAPVEEQKSRALRRAGPEEEKWTPVVLRAIGSL